MASTFADTRRRLPIWSAAGQSISHGLANLRPFGLYVLYGTLLNLTLLMIAGTAGMAGGGLADSHGLADAGGLAHRASMLLISIFGLVLSIPMTVGSYRRLLTDGHRSFFGIFCMDRRTWSYTKALILYGLTITAFSFLILIPIIIFCAVIYSRRIHGTAGLSIGGDVFAIVTMTVCFILSIALFFWVLGLAVRLHLSLVAAALGDETTTFRRAWKLSKNNIGRLIGTQLLISLPFIFLGAAFLPAGRQLVPGTITFEVVLLIRSFVGALFSLILVHFNALAYNFLVRDGQLAFN